MKYENSVKLILQSKNQSTFMKMKHKMFNLVYLLTLDFHPNLIIEIILIIFQIFQLLSFPINQKVKLLTIFIEIKISLNHPGSKIHITKI